MKRICVVQIQPQQKKCSIVQVKIKLIHVFSQPGKYCQPNSPYKRYIFNLLAFYFTILSLQINIFKDFPGKKDTFLQFAFNLEQTRIRHEAAQFN